MHITPFLLKRGHYSALKLLRPIAARDALTPARFDLLYALHAKQRGAPYQAYVARALGVCRSTVCRMIQAMQRAGMVILKVNIWDRRHKRIKVTRYGRRCFARAMKAIRRGEIDRAILRQLIGPTRATRAARRDFLHEMSSRVRSFALNFGDRADVYPYRLTQHYEWSTLSRTKRRRINPTGHRREASGLADAPQSPLTSRSLEEAPPAARGSAREKNGGG